MFQENSIETCILPRTKAQAGCMRQVLGPGALGRPRGIGWRGRWEGGSGWGIQVNPWLFHFNVWQKPLQYYKVISLQLIKINGKKRISHYLWFLKIWLCYPMWCSFLSASCEIHWASWICEFVLFIKFRKNLSQYFFKYFFSAPISFGDSSDMHIRQLKVVPLLINALFSSMFFLFHLNSCYCCQLQ